MTTPPKAWTEPRRKVFFDVSALRGFCQTNDSYTGIQRVVAEVISQFAAIGENGSVHVCWAAPSTGETYCLPISRTTREYFASPRALRHFFSPVERSVDCPSDEVTPLPTIGRHPLARYDRRPLRQLFHTIRLDVSLAIQRERAFRRYGISAADWKDLRNKRRDYQRDSASDQLKWTNQFEHVKAEIMSMSSPGGHPDALALLDIAEPGDHLVVLDASWAEHHRQAFLSARSAGLNISVMVHDLIPLLFPGTTAGDTPRVFANWLTSSREYATMYLANSENTRNDLERFLKSQNCDTPVETLLLAQDVVTRPSANNPHGDSALDETVYPMFCDTFGVREEVRRIACSDYAICVGTIEPRKNLWRLAAAWKLLLDQGLHDQLPKLVFAGRRGWSTSDFDDIMAGTGNIYGWAHFLEGPTDAELSLLYRRCLFFTNVSLYEGFGLPVGEGLSYGKTGVVSDAASLPEVGGDLVEYCSPTSIESIADAVKRLVCQQGRKTELEAKVRNARLRAWADVARDLTELLGDRPLSVSHLRPATQLMRVS